MWVGEAGAGSRLKLCANAWVGTMLEGIADSLALTRALGLDPQLFLDAVKGSAMDAPYVQMKGAAMLAESFEPAFTLAGALKDLDLILAAAEDAGLELGPDARRPRPHRPRVRCRSRRQGHGRHLARALTPARACRPDGGYG